MNSSKRIIQLALDTRNFIEPYYITWHQQWGGKKPRIVSTYTCARSSVFLKMILDYESNFFFRVVSGARATKFLKEKYVSHTWLESDTHIIDITADQFGDEPVLVLKKGDQRYQANKIGFIILDSVNRQKTINNLWAYWLKIKFFKAILKKSCDMDIF